MENPTKPHKLTAEVIPYRKDMDIRNLSALPRGTGARYLEVLPSHEPGVYIAKAWARKLKTAGTFIDFSISRAVKEVE